MGILAKSNIRLFRGNPKYLHTNLRDPSQTGSSVRPFLEVTEPPLHLCLDLIFPSEHLVHLGEIVSPGNNRLWAAFGHKVFLQVCLFPHHTHLVSQVS